MSAARLWLVVCAAAVAGCTAAPPSSLESVVAAVEDSLRAVGAAAAAARTGTCGLTDDVLAAACDVCALSVCSGAWLTTGDGAPARSCAAPGDLGTPAGCTSAVGAAPGRAVALNASTVALAVNSTAARADACVYGVLDRVFAANAAALPVFTRRQRWLSVGGALRSFPGVPAHGTAACADPALPSGPAAAAASGGSSLALGGHRDPVFVTGSSSPKTVLLLLDISGSMGGAPLTQAKAAAEAVVADLGPNDYVGVVAFETVATTLTPTTLRASAANKATVVSLIRALQSTGGTNFVAGFQNTFAMLNASCARGQESGCANRTVVLFLTDGESTDPTPTVAALNAAFRARVISYAFGSGVTASGLSVLRAVSCANGGFVQRIGAGSSSLTLQAAMSQYWYLLAYGAVAPPPPANASAFLPALVARLAAAAAAAVGWAPSDGGAPPLADAAALARAVGGAVRWTEPYSDGTSGTGWVTTSSSSVISAALPVFAADGGAPGRLLGVATVDVPLTVLGGTGCDVNATLDGLVARSAPCPPIELDGCALQRWRALVDTEGLCPATPDELAACGVAPLAPTVSPSATRSLAATPSSSATLASRSATRSPPATVSPSRTGSESTTPTATLSGGAVASATPSGTPSTSPSPTTSGSVRATPSQTRTPAATASPTRTPSATSGSGTPSVPASGTPSPSGSFAAAASAGARCRRLRAAVDAGAGLWCGVRPAVLDPDAPAASLSAAQVRAAVCCAATGAGGGGGGGGEQHVGGASAL